MLDLNQPISLQAVREAARIQARNKIKRYYPDTGPLRRALYPKHIEFFAAGSSHMERLAVAANRIGKCCTISSIVPTHRGNMAIGDLLERETFGVWAWNGCQAVGATALKPFKKPGLHQCYRITLRSGIWLEVADLHRFLTYGGWRRIGDLLQPASQGQRASISERGQLARGEDDPHSSQTPSDFQDCYFEDCRRYDAPLRGDAGSVSSSPPSQGDALPRSAVSLREDVRDGRYTNNRPPACDLPPNSDGRSQSVVRSAGFLYSDACRYGLPPNGSILTALPPGAAEVRFRPVPESCQSLLNQLLSLNPLMLDATNPIVAIEDIGFHEVYDFEVETWHNYIAANMVHHNSESIGAYEVSCHLTGLYPHWWPGRKFAKPVSIWAAGKTGETTRDIVQFKLLGQIGEAFEGAAGGGLGTGMIPADCIINTTPKQGLTRAIDTALIRHVSGGISTIGFKSYGKDRDSFEGTEKDVVWLDEEPPVEVKKECLMRLMTNNGLLIITFTPLDGYTEVVNEFLESTDADKWYIQIGWKDAPHLTPEMIAKMSLKYLPYELKARSEGVPSSGEGVIYPMDPDELTVDDFRIPDYWPRAFGLDVGKTAAIWGALDRESDILYLYREYYSEIYNTLIHAAAIKGNKNQDAWIPGFIDPASLGSSQVDGQKLFEIYTQQYGLNLSTADNAVEAGIYEVWARMCTGRLKVFRSLTGWRTEFLQYRRRTSETKQGEHTVVVKKKDHRMDAMRYLIMSGLKNMKTKPIPKPERKPSSALHSGTFGGANSNNYGWMRN